MTASPRSERPRRRNPHRMIDLTTRGHSPAGTEDYAQHWRMEAIMALRDLITWGHDQPSVPSRRGEEVSPFLTLHREMNRLFDDMFNNFGAPSLVGRMPAWPSVEVIQS